MTQDYELVYSLEIKILDLEKKVSGLEQEISGLRKQLKASNDEPASGIPDDVLQRIREGEHPVRALRQFRLMTQRDLGERSGIRANHISAIERGMPYGLKTARRLSEALDVPVGLVT